MKKLLAILTVGLLLAACGVDPRDATRTLEAQGMTNIHIGGYAVFGCGKDDEFRSKFTAQGLNGQAVSGVICGGWFKGYTVRYN